jgi:hypothetical protein
VIQTPHYEVLVRPSAWHVRAGRSKRKGVAVAKLPLSKRRSSLVSKFLLALFVLLGALFGPIGMVGADSASNSQSGASDESDDSAKPPEKPKPEPTKEPKPEPTEPTEEPTEEPKPEPTKEPKPEPTKEPKPEPTEEPAESPAETPVASPGAAPAVDAAVSSSAEQPHRPTALRQAVQPLPGPPSTNGIQPVFIGGNPDCADLGFSNEFRHQPVVGGTFGDGTLSVTITLQSLPQGPGFDWTSNIDVLGVIVKGGPNANFYNYGSGSTGDGDLHAPVNPGNNTFFGLSHLSFCYGEGPPPETGTIIINKDAIPDSTQGFGYTGTLGGFTLVDDGTGTQSSMVFTDLDAGDYDVTETGPPAGWNLTEISCQDPSGGTTTAGNTASIDLAEGETVSCTFINEQVPPPTPPPSPPPSPPNGGGGGAGGAGGGADGGDGGGAATGTGLAFTGFGLIPLALTGLALLMSGAGLLVAGRRSMSRRGRHRRTPGEHLPSGSPRRPAQLKGRRTTGLGFTGSGFLPLALTTVALVATSVGLLVADHRRSRGGGGRRPR